MSFPSSVAKHKSPPPLSRIEGNFFLFRTKISKFLNSYFIGEKNLNFGIAIAGTSLCFLERKPTYLLIFHEKRNLMAY